VIRAVVEDLGEADGDRIADLPAVVDLHRVSVGVQVARQQLHPCRTVARHRRTQLVEAHVYLLVDRLRPFAEEGQVPAVGGDEVAERLDIATTMSGN